MDIAKALDKCRAPLIDTGGRSRLINFPLKGRKTNRCLRIIGEDPDQVFRRLVIEAKPFQFDAVSDDDSASDQTLLAEVPIDEWDVDQTDDRLQSDRTELALDLCLETIGRQARSCIDETGVNMLYLALGMLEWYESSTSSEPRFAPLILVPVELRKEFDNRRKRRIFRLQYTGGDIQTNLSFGKRIEQDFGLKLPALQDGQSPSKYVDVIQEDVVSQQRAWKIHHEIVLAFFSFQKQLMYLDLDPKNWSNRSGRIDNAQITSIFEGVDHGEARPRYEEDLVVDEEPAAKKMLLVVDADSSQHSALCDIASGHDLVIEGPPGTGKSQTIINAIAFAMAAGKTVLFVAEKLAALKVVYQRLSELGLAHFCLNLHSDQATPRLVCDDLTRRLGATFVSPRELESVRQDLLRRRQQLKAYLDATAVEVGPLSLPLRDVFWRLGRLHGEGAFLLRTATERSLSREQFKDSVTALKALARHINELGTPSRCVWWGFDCPELASTDIPLLIEHLKNMLVVAKQFTSAIESLENLLGFASPWTNRWHSMPRTASEYLQAVTGKEDARLCSLLADPACAQAADAFVHDVTDFHEAANLAGKCCVDGWRPQVATAYRFRSARQNFPSGQLEGECTIGQIMQWQGRLSQIERLIRKAIEMMDQVTALGFDRPANLAQLDRMISLYALITDENITETHVQENLFLASAERMIFQAREQGNRLSDAEQSLAATFVLRDVPDRSALSSIRQMLRAYGPQWHRFLWGDYRQAKFRLKQFLSESARFKITKIVSELQRLEEYLDAVEQFSSDPKYARTLGPAFAGMATDWVRLEYLVRWAKTLVGKGVAAASAMRLLHQCSASASKPSVSELRAVADQLRDELRTLPSYVLGCDAAGLQQRSFDVLTRHIIDLQASTTSLLTSLAGFRHATDSTIAQISDASDHVIKTDRLEQEINNSNRYRHALPGFFEGTQTNIAHITTSLELIKHLKALRLDAPILRWLFSENPSDRARQLAQALELWLASGQAWSEHLELLKRYGTYAASWVGVWDSSDEPSPTERLEVLLEHTGQISTWAEFCRARCDCDQEGVSAWVNAVTRGEMEVDRLVESFDYTVHHWVAQREIANHPSLQRFSRQKHEQIRKEFADLDRQLIKLQRDQVAWLASNRIPPAGISTGRVGEYTQMGMIYQQVILQRKHRSIRELVRRAGGALAALKPCWMMSPLAVAQFIEPGTMVFDLVIMDEASQIKPADALGSIARAEQVVVVGDDKQMPPATWMERMGDTNLNAEDDEDETLADDSESILEWASKAYRRTRRLKWHYRSEHESLIAFSNEKFYDGELIVFPAPNRKNGRLGLRFHHVPDGRWAARCNVPEARQVAQAVIQHVKSPSCGSLGVATFNAPQVQAIQEEFDRILAVDAEARHALDRLNRTNEPFFIKNVENLQGDERDMILISYTYGPDTSGTVAQQFFPINTDKGWRRFNVMVTRARQRVEVYTSILPDQITGGNSRPRGVLCMRDYLTYAKDGIMTDMGSPSGRLPDSDFEVAVARVLQAMGYQVSAQVGVAGYFMDLAVCRPGTSNEFALGIECDGAAYHSSRSARDRDRLRQEVIERRGWQLHRIWSTDWFHNRISEEARLQRAVEKALGKGLS